MPVPIICLDDEVCQFAERFREQFTKPQYQYFVIVRQSLDAPVSQARYWARSRSGSEPADVALVHRNSLGYRSPQTMNELG